MFLEYLRNDEKFDAAAARLRRGGGAYAPSFYAPYVLAAALEDGAARMVVAPDGEAATRLAADLSVYLDRAVPVLPARGVLYGADVAPAPHVVGERQQALTELAAGGVVVAEAVALLERFLPLELQPRPLALAPGDGDRLRRRRRPAGRARLRARRAGPRPRRVRRARRPHRRLPGPRRPAARRVLGRRGRDAAHLLHLLAAHHRGARGGRDRVRGFRGGHLRSPSTRPACARRWPTGSARAGRGRRRSWSAAPPCARSRRWPAGSPPSPRRRRPPAPAWAVFNPDETYRALADFDGEVQTAVPGAGLRERLYVPLADARARLTKALHLDVVQRDQPLQFAASRPQFAARDLASAERDLVRLVNDDYRVFVVFRHEGEAERATYRLRNLSAEVVTPEQMAKLGEAGPGLYFLAAPLREGFVAENLKLAVVNERALIRSAPRERRFAAGTRLTTFFDVRPGDHVVHEDHGIARFAGIETRTVAGVTRDYLLLEFRGEDRVFVPHDQIGKVSRYVGASGAAPSLDKLGGTHWQTVKTRARTAVVEMAGELLQLYAARQAIPGFAYPPDGELMRRLEEAFPYEETDDQAEAIDEVKNDMEAPHPMDRLICGDVGYGKTEVALRAAFKAAEAGKQTLVLVPTTILAEQHWMTFEERFGDLPVKVGMVSRFRSGAEQKKTLAAFGRGEIDVLVGTHRLLSTDVRPKELGLVIVDEEQRFGVRQKELLRNLKLQVDVMSLSATPIPRTLQMSLSGIRDISVIETAPRGRHEIRTYIGEYRDDLVRVAIEKELAREGQAFYLHNRVETIDQAAEHVQALVPGARVLVAHGQMAGAPAREGHAGVPRRRRRRAGDDVDHRERHRHPDGQHAHRGARGHARARAALPDPRAHRAQRRARVRLPALPERRPADERRGRAPDHAERPHRPRRRLQDRHGRPRDPRRRQPARRRAERARRRRRLRDVRADARGGGATSWPASSGG